MAILRADMNAAVRQLTSMAVINSSAVDIATAVVASSCLSKLLSLTSNMRQKVSLLQEL